ncbi:MAG: monofunctional biosynthetic peptidoglycan transglycosylase [Campylobacterales bacterium]|nr:monofunctional biosynthetic peptidoglycan transglycosylase [Campylobacterales bacterium]
MRKKIKIAVALIALFFTIDIGRYFVYPSVSTLAVEKPIPTAFMEYRKAQWADEGKPDKTIDQRWVDFRSMSPYLVKAVLISEDDGFWNNDGFEKEEMMQAFEKNLKAGKFVSGGSTVTQQLAKNIYLSPSKNPIRKLKEAILTYRMNKTLSKRRIIELYLNCAEWGDGIFGIEAAARHYYGKSARNLSAMEAAKLAAILPNPILYQPEQKGRIAKKSAYLYRIMTQRGIIVKEFEEVMKPEPKEDANATVESNASDMRSTEEINKTDGNESKN